MSRFLQETNKAIVWAITPWWVCGALLEILWTVFYGRETPRGFAISGLGLIFGAFCFIQALFAVNGTTPTPFANSPKAVAAAGSALNGAWLSVASCIGVLTVVPDSANQVELAAVVLAICAGAAVFISLKTSSVVYPLVLVWALLAVVLVEDRAWSVRVFAIIGICLSGLATVVAAVRKVLAAKAATETPPDAV